MKGGGSMALIEVKNICKEFKVYKRQKGVLNTMKAFFAGDYTIKHAVEDVSFSIEKGELVGYVGPNGAGKSTTIKMLSGILYPTSGEVSVRGVIPQKNRRENAMHIGVVFGQRSQLYWDLPLSEALELYRKMYKVEKRHFEQNVERFTELLSMKEFIDRPIRQLSLGQKMRAELAVALLHDPEILYLDEPTIGLDVVAKQRIREFINTINAERKTTVILTTHDMDDIEQICTRLILIDQGKLLYDGTLPAFYELYGGESVIELTLAGKWSGGLELNGITSLKAGEDNKVNVVFHKKQLKPADIMRAVMQTHDIMDFKLTEPRLEDILRKIYDK